MSCGFLALPAQRKAAGWAAMEVLRVREGMAGSVATAA